METCDTHLPLPEVAPPTTTGIRQRLLRGRIEVILIIALGVAVFAPGLARAPLLDWDEATYVQVVRESLANHAYLDFSWNGAPYMKKPPMLFWVVAGSFNAFGESEFAARLPSMLCALLTMLLLYATACEVGGRIAGTFAAIVPLGFYFFVARGGRECATDPLLVMFSTLALYAMLRARHSRRWLPLAGAAIGLAILSKGAAGLIPLIVVALAVAMISEFSSLGLGGFAIIVAAAALVASPWYLYEAVHNPLFWKTFIGHETLSRFATHLEDETKPATYTLWVFVKETYWLLPLAIPLWMLAKANAREGLARAFHAIHPALKLWIIWLIVAFASACAVQTRLPWYVLPALIPVALIAGSILGWAFSGWTAAAHLSRGNPRAVAGVVAMTLLLMFAPERVWVISKTIAAERAKSIPNLKIARRARDAARELGAGELYFAGVELPGLVYYSGLHCNFVQAAEADLVGLGRVNEEPISMSVGDLVLVPIAGMPTLVANLYDEWGVPPPFFRTAESD
jgi:4-amino-4-deoxy-L-arabinose transferase-like glycosyltransferase